MIMNVRSYKIAHRSHAVSQLQDPDDIATALAGLYVSTSYDYDQYKFSAVRKSFSSTDIDTKNKHETASVILIGLNVDALEIIEQWPNLEDQEKMKVIYNQARRGRLLPDTPLNELNTKLANVKRVVEYMKSVYPLVIRRTYFYQNHKLFIDQLKPVPFREGTDADIVLTLLFKTPFKRWRHIDLERRLIKTRYRVRNVDTPISFGTPLKNAIEHINFQIDKKYNILDDRKLIFQNNGFVGVDTRLFHVVDRLNRKQ